MSDFSNTWERLLTNIKPKVSEANYNNWIKQIKFIAVAENDIKLGAPNGFVKGWILDYYQEMILQELFTLTQKNFTLAFEITGENAPIVEEEVIETRPTPRQADPTITINTNGEKTHRLNHKYTFEKFVVGSSNQFAHAAAMAAGDLPGGHYNPLFIYGGVGLGKTHLLNAIGLKIKDRFPESRILYMSAEQFMNELIFCIRFEKMDKFRKKYRDGCDVLLIDDVQFMIGKERTQEEFFHTFNSLYEDQRQIVVTSDKLPKDLNGLEERLRSRFEWGLIADIQAPDLETRIAILKKKADLNGILLANDVALFLASQVKSNVRELEGSLIRLSAFASLEKGGATITVDFAKEVLKNIIRERVADCSIEAIQRIVADFYHMKVSDLKSPRRLKSITLPRQIAMFLCKGHLNSSYPEIGHKFGGKDHSTVIHAVKKIRLLRENDAVIKKDIELIEKTLLD
jgi:chromosomal replication initiator protein